MRKDTIIWAGLCLLVGIVVVVYLSSALDTGDDALIMPLDDTYIHFQYARQMARGHPFAYNTGDAPTSGSTSFLYVPLLAVGYAAGFTGLSLAHWAVAWGVGGFVLSAWLVYRSVCAAGGSRLLGVLMMLTFALNGAFVWAALSGMETMLFVASVLLCAYAYQVGWRRKAALAGVLAALVRPEGALVAVTLAAALAWRHWRAERRLAVWTAWPVLAAVLQPVTNLLLTGSLSATGNQAKSHFFDVTVRFLTRLERVWDAWVRTWRELIEGHAAYGDPYVPGLVVILALVMVGWGVKKSLDDREIHPALLAAVWMGSMSAAVATLGTAFWHYKRYHLPLMALTLPLAGWLLAALASRLKRQWLPLALAGIGLLLSAQTNLTFIPLYRNNVYVVSRLQLGMAQWIAANLPGDALVGVFDVGTVRYAGERATYDVVGLTTPDAAAAMRQGPGAVYDTMAAHTPRPGYFALYPDVHALTVYLMQTSAWGQELARFEVEPVPNTTSAGPVQLVAEADWSGVALAERLYQPVTLAALDGFRPVGMLNVGDAHAERDYDYAWENRAVIPGYLAPLEQRPYYACEGDACAILDGTRGVNGQERFALPAIPSGEDYRVVLRVHAAEAARLVYGCEGELGVRRVPEIPGNWVEIVFPVPGEADAFCIDAQGTYYPARYWIYAGQTPPPPDATDPLADWGGLALMALTTGQTDTTLTLDLTWSVTGDLSGDGLLFVHLYAEGVPEPVAQWDGYLGQTTPLANLLPGTYAERVQLSLADLPPGDYVLGAGFVDRQTGQRYPVQAERTDDAGERAFLAVVTVP